MNKKITARVLQLGAGVAAALAIQCQAQSVDALLDKLVDKGILTPREAKEMRAESDKDFTKAYAAKTGMQDWVSAIKFNGDLRGRYEGFFANNPNFADRHRFRYRLRAGFVMAMQDDLEVGFRLGSGDLDSAGGITAGVDPISNNQSFQNNASKKGIFVDQVYGRWTFLRNSDWAGELIIGKMENPFVLDEMVFDADYTPEGVAQKFKYTINDQHSLSLNLGGFVLDEVSAGSDDPWMFGVQLRHDAKWTPKLSGSGGLGFLKIQNAERLTSSSVPDMNVGNARATSTSISVTASGSGTRNVTNVVLNAPLSDFHPVVADYALTYLFEAAPFYTGPFPVKVFGEYLVNPGAKTSSDTGWNAGITFGKAGKRRTWEVTYKYKYLEGDAWWEELVDSDSGAFYNTAATVPPPASLRAPGRGYGAGTNIRGHVVKAGYSPYDSVTLNFTWFGLELIEPHLPDTDSTMNRIQADVIFKF